MHHTRYSFLTLRRQLLTLLLLAVASATYAQAPGWQTAAAIGGGGGAIVRNTATDASGNIILAGSFSGTATFGSTTLVSAGGNDVFVAKWNPATSTFVWAQRGGGTGPEDVYGLALSGSNIYVSGFFSSSSAAFGTTTLTRTGDLSGFVVKLTDAGSTSSFTWAQLMGGTGSVYTSAVAVSGTSVYVVGDADSPTINFGSISLTTVSGDDAFLAKLTDAGSTSSFVWARRAGGTDISEATFITAVTAQGNNIYMTGGFIGNSTIGSTTLTGTGTTIDVFVTKATDAGATGSFTWAQAASSTGTDYPLSIASSGSNIYIGGYFTGPTATFGSTSLTNAGTSNDGFVAKYTDAGTSGSAVWAQRLGGTVGDLVNYVVASGNAVCAAGSFTGNASFGSTTFASAGGSDVFVTRLTDAGATSSFTWSQQAGGAGADAATALAVSGGALHVFGRVTPPATFGTLSIPNPTPGPTGFAASLGATALPTQSATARAAFSLYPNPASTLATVKLPTGAATNALTLTDAQGRVVRRYPVQPAATEATLDLRGLAAGLYVVRNGAAAQKLVVE